ncbi:hypothetical protein [Rossellomorea vietnamensis]|uniref:Uncharacterized protein n=1 Tax=Rossellomorea vietnamensis TaxID=218284 RepID=A0ACD4CCG9_9BACI|nr:hypothetical protein [Rossellomorea vietnamensis]UXH46225.1 hypothetical protein N5C46_09335 [Rossellomorea vietnamensis]WQI97670.1 hypothetical protein Q7C14_09915 [Rossellomorea vietnamensis]
MVYFIIGIIVVLIIFLLKKASKPEPLQENRYEIYSYVVMEDEDEEKFGEADQPLWDLAERHSFLHPGQILCRVDRYKDVHQEEWDEIRKYSSFTKAKEPYYIFFDEYRADKDRPTQMAWDQKVFETNNLEEVEKWCEEFEKEIFEKHDVYVGKVYDPK